MQIPYMPFCFFMWQARLFDEPQLASLCLDTIDKSTADAINAEGFTDIDLGMWALLCQCVLFFSPLVFLNVSFWILPLLLCVDTLCAVLQRDTLSIRENRLFGAVVRWAEAECYRQQLPPTSENKQKVLGKALPLIRFPLMTVEEFAAGTLFSLFTFFMILLHCSNLFSFFFEIIIFVVQLKPQKPAWYSFLCNRACPVWNIVRSGGGKSVFTLYSKPQTTGRLHWQATLLPQGGGVQHS